MKSFFSAAVMAGAFVFGAYANAATTWTSDSDSNQPGNLNVWTSTATAAVTETEVLTFGDLCNQLVVTIDGSVAVTPSIILNTRTGGVSVTAVNADVVAASGSTTIINDGVRSIKMTAANTTSNTTVNFEVKQYRHKLCSFK